MFGVRETIRVVRVLIGSGHPLCRNGVVGDDRAQWVSGEGPGDGGVTDVLGSES